MEAIVKAPVPAAAGLNLQIQPAVIRKPVLPIRWFGSANSAIGQHLMVSPGRLAQIPSKIPAVS